MIAVALASYMALVWLRPRLALGTLLFLVPFGHLVRFSVVGIPFTFVEVAAYLLALVVFAHGGARHFSLRDSWIVLSMLWVLVAALAAWYSPAGIRAWGIWKAYFVAPVLLSWIMRALRDERDAMRHVIAPLALGALGVAALAIAQRWFPIGVPYPWSLPGKFRATSVFGYPNAVGLYLAPIAVLTIGMIARSARTRSVVAILVTAAAILAIWFAKSTGALVALTIAIPAAIAFLTLRSSRITHSRCWATVLLLAWVAVSLALTAWLPYRHEQSKWGPPIVQKLTFQKWSGSVRLAQYRETWQLLRDHPIRGAGLAGYQTAIAPYHTNSRVEIFLYPHNLLLAVWVELGLAGLLIFLAILYQLFRVLFSPPHDGRGSERGWGLRAGLIAAMLVILIHGLVDVPYFKNDLAILFWAIVALVGASTVELERVRTTA
ncbi:MAG: O-antigen ligase family protein [bacterium]|nr:O-antigen ligase family protein [bacterium]